MAVEYTFDPFEIAGVDKDQLTRTERETILRDVKEYVLTSVLEDVSKAMSPVDGSKFPGLSPDYKKKKVAEGGRPIADLELFGDMLSGLRVNKSGDQLTLTVVESQQDKADGHNNHSGQSSLPLRRFIPLAGEDSGFRSGIERGIKDLVEMNMPTQDRSIDQLLRDLVDTGVTVSIRSVLDGD